MATTVNQRLAELTAQVAALTEQTRHLTYLEKVAAVAFEVGWQARDERDTEDAGHEYIRGINRQRARAGQIPYLQVVRTSTS